MDRTLKTAKRKNKRRQNRNGSAWRRFSPDGTTCRYCKHDHTTHLTSSGQPHFYRPATEAEKRDPSVMLYRHTLPQGGSVLVRRMVVANHAELVTAFCTACAESIGTHQVLCYQRNVGVGEVVGVQTGHRDMAIAARRSRSLIRTQHTGKERRPCQRNRRCSSTAPTATNGSRRWRSRTGTSTPGRPTTPRTLSGNGIQMIFQAVTVEDYVPPPRAAPSLRRDCHFCNPEPCRFGPSTDTTDDTEKGETT